MKLPTEKKKKDIKLQGKSILLYSKPRVGKTTFCAKFPEPLFLQTEEGTHAHEVFSVNILTWKDAIDALKELQKNPSSLPYKTIVVDTAVNLHNMCTQHSVASLAAKTSKSDAEHPSDFAFGKGWHDVNSRFFNYCNDLTRLGFTVIFTAHEKEEIDFDTGKPTGLVKSNLPPKIHNILAGMCDIIVHGSIIEGRTPEGKIAQQRVLQCHATAKHDVGDRLGVLPPRVPMNYEAFASHFSDAPQKKQPAETQAQAQQQARQAQPRPTQPAKPAQ